MLSLQLRLLVLAIVQFTRLPIGSGLRTWTHELPAWRGLRYLPVAGLLAAIPMVLVYAIAGLWLPHPIALLAALAAGLLLTAAIHERALAAWCDRADGGHEGPTVDPRSALGPAGVLGLALTLLVKFETLSPIDPSWIALSMLCAATFSRACAVCLLATLTRTPERAPGAVGDPPDGADSAIALAGALLPLAAAVAWTGDAGVFATAAILALAAAVIVRRIAGPDASRRDSVILGALQQLAEIGFYVGLLATLTLIDENSADPAS